jgi:hypothetical protein
VRRVRLTIDSIVFKGFDPADRKAVVEGLERQLAEAVAGRPDWHSHRRPVLRLGRLPFEPGPSGARKFGWNAANEIGRGLKP